MYCNLLITLYFSYIRSVVYLIQPRFLIRPNVLISKGMFANV